MRYRLRTLMVLLAVLPPVIGLAAYLWTTDVLNIAAEWIWWHTGWDGWGLW